MLRVGRGCAAGAVAGDGPMTNPSDDPPVDSDLCAVLGAAVLLGVAMGNLRFAAGVATDDGAVVGTAMEGPESFASECKVF